jgi:hypothetical protein
MNANSRVPWRGDWPIEPNDLLRYLAGVCDAMKLRYFVTGSMATIFYGEPRFTNDVDVIVSKIVGQALQPSSNGC